MNKKGEKFISVYWFAILFIVAAAVVYIVASFYGQPYDVREIEADILTDKISECVSYVGELKSQVFEEDFDKNFLEICNLNFNVEPFSRWEDQDQYYVELEVFNFGTNDLTIPKISEGNSNLKSSCLREGKYQPICLNRSFYSLDSEGNQYRVNILSIVRKTEKNVQ